MQRALFFILLLAFCLPQMILQLLQLRWYKTLLACHGLLSSKLSASTKFPLGSTNEKACEYRRRNDINSEEEPFEHYEEAL